MIDDWGMPTLWAYDSGDELDEGDVAPCSCVMKGTCFTFIFLTKDLWALPHQILQKGQVTLLGQLDGKIQWNLVENRERWQEKGLLAM